MKINTIQTSHGRGLATLNALYQYHDFMESIKSMIDLGCGAAQELEWWATRTADDDNPTLLNIDCLGIDLCTDTDSIKKYPNMTKVKADFESYTSEKKFDVLWCHDAFQFAITPIQTLMNWRNIASDGAMLVLIVPQTTNVVHQQLAFEQASGTYYHYSLVNLIHMLAVAGWDCKAGFFSKHPYDSWIHAIVYRGEHPPFDPRTTTWYDLVEARVLPDSADKSIMAHGCLRQQDLILPWLDQSLAWYGKQ